MTDQAEYENEKHHYEEDCAERDRRDHIDEIIEGVVGALPGDTDGLLMPAVRAVAEAAYVKGCTDTIETTEDSQRALAGKPTARQEFARELLQKANASINESDSYLTALRLIQRILQEEAGE